MTHNKVSTGTILAARSRAKMNEYRSTQLKEGGAAWRKLPRCKRCESFRFDSAVTGPDVDGMCGPSYCHYALSN